MVKGRKMTEAEDVTAVTIPYEALRDFTAALFAAAGAPEADAAVMGECLAGNDLHGSSGHGTACAADPDTGGWQGYVNRMLPGPDQSVNPAPNVQMVEQSGTTAVFDGDGGMGHVACRKAVDWAIATAKEHGTACVTTRNHFHFGGSSSPAPALHPRHPQHTTTHPHSPCVTLGGSGRDVDALRAAV